MGRIGKPSMDGKVEGEVARRHGSSWLRVMSCKLHCHPISCKSEPGIGKEGCERRGESEKKHSLSNARVTTSVAISISLFLFDRNNIYNWNLLTLVLQKTGPILLAVILPGIAFPCRSGWQ